LDSVKDEKDDVMLVFSLFTCVCARGGAIVLNPTFDNIVVISGGLVLLVEETGVPGENHRPVASH